MVAVQRDRAALEGAEGEGFIQFFLLVGMQLDGKWKLRKVKLWLSGVGLCLVIQWRLS